MEKVKYTDRFLRETFASLMSDGETIRPDLQRVLNQYLKQSEDYVNNLEFINTNFTRTGLVLTTKMEIIEYSHHPQLNMRFVIRKKK